MSGETTITMVGNLTGDPELRFTPAGVAVAAFTVASTPRTFDKGSNEWKDGDPLFMRCNIWREAAEHAAESLKKGMRVMVIGTLRQRSYEKDGARHTVIEVTVEEVGPSLKYAIANVQKAGRSGGNGGQQQSGGQGYAAAEADPWQSSGGPAPF